MQKDNNPSLSTTSLPPLSKVRCCRPKKFGRLPEGLPHHYPLAPHQPSRTRTITLASLVKGRWIDGKAQTVALLHFYLRYIHLFDLSNFSPSRRRDCLITISRLHQPSRTRTIPCFAPTPLPPLSKARCCRPKEFGRLPEGLLFYRTLSVSQTPPLTIPQ